MTIQQLARAANVAYSSAHREVELMRPLGLLRTKQVGRAVVCSWNAGSSASQALTSLLSAATREKSGAPTDEVLYWNLRRMGAPLALAGSKGEPLTKEETLGYSLDLTRRQPEVARVWPVVYARHREELDRQELAHLAGRLGQKRTLGFFLELTGTLLGEPVLPDEVNRGHDRRFRKTQDFFTSESSERARALAELRTPDVAKNWQFRMNMPLESFKTSFDKFGGRSS